MPRTIDLPESGRVRVRLDDDEDARLVWPDSPFRGQIEIEGGRNVYSSGGYITGGYDNDEIIIVQPGSDQSNYQFEGLHVDVDGQRVDIFALRNGPGVNYSVLIENSRLGTPEYDHHGFHGDVIQLQDRRGGEGGVDLTVRNVTAEAEQQGFFLPDLTTGPSQTTMENVNSRFSEPYSGDNRGILYWFADGNRNPYYNVELSNVYAATDLHWEATVPAKRHGAMYDESEVVDFRSYTQIDGEIALRAPAGGDFAPADKVGLNYDSAFFFGSGADGGGTTTEPEPSEPESSEPEPTAPPAAADEVIGAVRAVRDLDLDRQTVDFGASLDDAVVFATPATLDGGDPVTTRIRAIGDGSVTLQLDEPGYVTDGFHVDETVTVLALEEGVWRIADGRRLEVGTIETDNLVGDGFVGVDFSQRFDDAPVVLTQVQTDNGGDWVVTRVRDVTADGFRVAMQEVGAKAGSGHVTETVGWLALDAGTIDWDGIDAQAFRTGTRIDSDGAGFGFADAVGAQPLIAAGLASFFGPDPANLRLAGLDDGTARFVAREEQSADRETDHVDEDVAGLAFDGEGLLDGGTFIA
jgi:hypothetical protein